MPANEQEVSYLYFLQVQADLGDFHSLNRRHPGGAILRCSRPNKILEQQATTGLLIVLGDKNEHDTPFAIAFSTQNDILWRRLVVLDAFTRVFPQRCVECNLYARSLFSNK